MLVRIPQDSSSAKTDKQALLEKSIDDNHIYTYIHVYMYTTFLFTVVLKSLYGQSYTTIEAESFIKTSR